MSGMAWTAIAAWAFIIVCGPRILRSAGLWPRRRRERGQGGTR
jgi:hypothetical protein